MNSEQCSQPEYGPIITLSTLEVTEKVRNVIREELSAVKPYTDETNCWMSMKQRLSWTFLIPTLYG